MLGFDAFWFYFGYGIAIPSYSNPDSQDMQIGQMVTLTDWELTSHC